MNLSKNSLVPLLGTLSIALSLGFVPACGDVDPQDNQGDGGDAGSAGTGNTGNTGNVAAGAAAGSPDSGGSPNAGAGGEPAVTGLVLLPWAVGNTWTYNVTKDGSTTEKTTTIVAEEPVGGEGPNSELMAYHVVTAKGVDGTDKTESWQAPNADNPLRIERYQEKSFGATTGNLQMTEYWDPSKLHIDGSPGRVSQGDTWLEVYEETKLEVGLPATTHKVNERWTVLGDDETVDVPAGTFEGVIHLQKVGSGSTKEYWYKAGVGKVKETGSQTEELVDYHLEETP